MGPSAESIPPVCAVVGSDRSMRLEALEEVMRPITSVPTFAGATRVDGADADLAEVLDDVRTPSLLGDFRVVVVENADKFITDNRKTLERYCAAPSDTGTLILLCNSLPKSTRLYKAISSSGRVVAIEPLKGRNVVPWIEQRAKSKYGKRIAPRAATMLREHVGDAAGMLDAEIAKLSDYVGERDVITAEDIEALTGRHREEKVFAVTDAIASGNTKAAIEQWEQVLATDRAAQGRAIAGMAWGVRRLLDARRAWERGGNLSVIARQMYTDPVTLQRRLERVDTAALEEQQSDLLTADLAVKTGGSTVATAIEKFIVKHSTKRSTPSRKARVGA